MQICGWPTASPVQTMNQPTFWLCSPGYETAFPRQECCTLTHILKCTLLIHYYCFFISHSCRAGLRSAYSKECIFKIIAEFKGLCGEMSKKVLCVLKSSFGVKGGLQEMPSMGGRHVYSFKGTLLSPLTAYSNCGIFSYFAYCFWRNIQPLGVV